MNESSDNDENENSSFKEFGPITPDDKVQGYGAFFSNLFKWTKSKSEYESTPKKTADSKHSSVTQVQASTSPGISFEPRPSNVKTFPSDLSTAQGSRVTPLAGVEALSHERTLPNVLKRIKNITDRKGSTPQPYRDADFKQFWLPDHLRKECYDCSEKFTPLRRRHHCRICGQIFCSKCCNRVVPAKILGFSAGELRVCTFCYKVVFCCLKTNNIEEDVLADLNVFEEELMSSKAPAKLSAGEGGSFLSSDTEKESVYEKRGNVYGFMEENYTIKSRGFTSGFASVDQRHLEQIASERQLLLKDSQQLQSLLCMMVSGPNKLPLSTNRYRIKTIVDSFIGRDFVQWLLDNDKASSRQSAVAIGQALLEAGFIIGMSENDQFVDEHALFKIKADALENQTPSRSSRSGSQDMDQEPLWLEQISSHREGEDYHSLPAKYVTGKADSGSLLNISASSSNYSLDLNVKESFVSLKNPRKSDAYGNLIGNVGYDGPETSVSAVLNDTIRSILSEQQSTSTVMTEEVLEALKTLEPKLAESLAAAWQIKSEQEENSIPEAVDEQTKMSLATKIGFNDIWRRHENRLLLYLLRSFGLDISWCRTMVPFIYKVVDTVHPDVKNENDDMDIRRYIQFKKVPGGEISECRIVNGTVCTKNITHSQMKSQLMDPQILIIASHIDYHRSNGKNKGNSIEDVLNQEELYINNVVSKIMTYKPDIVITMDGVSYMARQRLLAEGITLIMNVKASVIERIARCTQAKVFPSIDKMEANNINNDLPHNALGMCHSFYINSFNNPSSHLPKHLMYFDGCATHLGCTIILRGATNMELKRVKKIMNFMIFALYNWKLERSYMMDVFAAVPLLKSFNNGESREETIIEKEGSGTCCESEDKASVNPTKPFSGSVFSNPVQSSPSKTVEANLVSDNSDPLRSYLSSSPSDKTGESEKESPSISANLIPFSTALADAVVSVSPYIKFFVPFLETEEGKASPLRRFFSDELYFSSSFNFQQPRKTIFQEQVPKKTENNNVVFRPSHDFITSKLTKSVNDTDIKTSLADYRARGGIIHNVCPCEKIENKVSEEKIILQDENAADDQVKEISRKFECTPEGSVDALHPFNHQRISILFSNFSQSFHYTSVFCVNPRVLTMAFYGRNDITLGSFLERYCFDPQYECLSTSCQEPILDHVRKFVHEQGCIEILLRKMDSSLDNAKSSNIFMWTWCKICKTVSPVVPMASDTWSFSFAKYLELRFHDSDIRQRGSKGCSHSIHQKHYHYFMHMDMVAVIKYITIPTRDLVMPPTIIHQTLNTMPHAYYVDMIKAVAIQGYGVFSSIVDRLSTISEEIGQRWDPLLESVALHHQQLKQKFRESIENTQWQLTSPTLEQHWTDFSSPNVNREISTLVFSISDQIVLLKGIIAQVVQDWNGKVEDLMKLRKKEEKEKFRTNSGNMSRQSGSQLSSVSSALAGSAEQLHVISKDDAVFQPSETAPSEVPCEPVCRPEKNTVISEENRISAAHPANEESFSENVNRISEIEKGDKTISAEIMSSLSACGEMERDVSGGLHVVPGLQEESGRKRKISNSSLVRSGLEQFIPSKGCHERSLSDDAEVSIAKEALERIPEKRYSSSVKNIISKVLSSSEDLKIKNPFDPSEHYNNLSELRIPVVVYDGEPSSIIARALASFEYETKLQLLQKKLNESPQGMENRILESQSSVSSTTGSSSQDESQSQPSTRIEGEKSLLQRDSLIDQKDMHIDLQWSDQNAKYYCKVLFVEQFRQLRQVIYPLGEDYYIRSLSRCVYWDARGGKSGSSFCKTSDDRFVLKEMSKSEFSSFLEFGLGQSYIEYMVNCHKNNLPTALTRIIGVYRIGFKNTVTNKGTKLDLLVMENLFYQRCIGPKFDLKGSERNRKVTLTGKEQSEVVLMDENLMQMACSNPFYLRPHGKDVLTRAVVADSSFLAQQLVMDYSLLVGVDEENNELIVGIIDYIRTFTWDKKLETMIKGGVLGTGKLPTVVSPEVYRTRFCLAMESYFVVAPDRWSALGIDIET